MKISEFEQRLQENNTPTYFPPDEDKWLKLAADLQRPKRKIIPLPFNKRTLLAAAAVALLISVATYIRYIGTKDAVDDIAIKKTTKENSTLQPAPPSKTISNQSPTPVLSGNPVNPSSYTHTGKPVPNTAHHPYVTPQHPVPHAEPIIEEIPVLIDVPVPERAVDYVVTKPNPTPVPGNGRRLESEQLYREPNASPVTFGVSAQYGFSEISKSQYRLAVSARKPISDRVFANVALVASNANISVSNTYQYQVIALGAPGANPENDSRAVDAVYSASVYSIGVTPAIGVKIGKILAIAAGPDIQKTLATKVPLENGNEFVNDVNSETLVDEQKKIAGFDVGVQSTAQFSLSKRASFNLMYRYGLTDYVKKHAGSGRNSFLGVGLSYSLE